MTERDLGQIELPYGTHITRERYAFQLDYRDTNNQTTAVGEPKYFWECSGDPVPVCPDRDPNGTKEWISKGWGLGPAGVNMLWPFAEEDSGISEPQAQATDDFYIGSDLLLYAIGRPRCAK